MLTLYLQSSQFAGKFYGLDHVIVDGNKAKLERDDVLGAVGLWEKINIRSNPDRVSEMLSVGLLLTLFA